MDIVNDLNSNKNSAQPDAPTVAVTRRPTPFERREVLSSAVDIASPAHILEHLIRAGTRRRGCSVVGVSAPYATAMADDADLKAAFLSADILIPDGKGFSWGAKMLGVPCGERIAIPDLCEQLLADGNLRQWKVFIYGATEEVNTAACANLRTRFPNLAEVSGQQGYNQGLAEEDALIERLALEKFNLLIVARPSPDKEKFLTRCCPKSGVVGLAAGGYADILAGKTSRAPRFIQALGMEWLYRVAQEPRRLWKRVGVANLRFGLAVLWKHLTMRPNRPLWGSRCIQAVLLALAVVAAYATSLNAPFHFDDPEYLERNPTIRWRSGEGVSALVEKMSKIEVLGNRKVWWLSNAICFRLSDDFGIVREEQVSGRIIPDVRIFRVWNIACHFFAALALWGLLLRCFRANGSLKLGREGRGTPWDLAALGAAAIFAAHPLCTESVTYICGRDNGQGGMFYLLGLYFAAVAFERMGLGIHAASSTLESTSHLPPLVLEETISTPSIPRWPSWFWPLMIAASCGGLAVLTKEIYLTFAGAVALLYLCFYRGTRPTTVSLGLLIGIAFSMLVLAWGAAGRHEGYLGTASLLTLFFMAGGYFCGVADSHERPAIRSVRSNGAWRWRNFLTVRVRATWAFVLTVLGLGGSSIVAFPYAYQRVISAFSGYQESSYLRSLCTQAYAVPCMLLKGIAPLGLNIDHDFPSLTSFSDARVQTGAAILLVLLLLGLYGMWKRSLMGFAVLLALLSIAPSNSVIERGDIVSERNFYLVAASGACLIVWIFSSLTTWTVRFFDTLPDRSQNNALKNLREAGLWAGVLCVCVAGPFSALTVVRNDEWASSYRLWSASRELSPNKMRVLYNFGVAARSRKNPIDAIEKYQAEAETAFSTAITIGEDKSEKGLFRPDEAVEVQCFHMAYANLAAISLDRYLKKGKTNALETIDRVDKIFKNGLERTTYDPDLAFMYAQFLMQLSRSADAMTALQHSLNLHSWADHLYFPLGFAYLDLGEFEKAEHYLSLATHVRNVNVVGGSLDMPKERQSECYAFCGLAQLLNKNKAGAKVSFCTAFQSDPQGIFLMLTATQRTRNHKLHAVEYDPPDHFLTAISQTRRDLLNVLIESVDAVWLNTPEKKSTAVSMLKNAMIEELVRRDREQKKRIEFGFKDDPDRIE